MGKLNSAMRVLRKLYEPASIEPYAWEEDTVTKVIEHFLREEVNKKSSPGVPWHSLGTTNEMVLKGHRSLIVSIVLARLRLLSTVDCRDLTAEERVKRGFCDPVRLFVKNEPHGEDKARSKRWRLIMSVSLVDQLVERVLNARLNKSEVRNWRVIPSKGGSSMYNTCDVNHVRRWMAGKDLAEADISGFDWSVKFWELCFDAELRILLSPGASESWKQALRARVDCLSLSVFSLSDGRLIAQKVKGIQKSGSYNTTPSNSHIRVLLAHLVGSKDAIAIGDDGLETFVSNAVDIYRELGHPLKMYARCVDRATFCSMEIGFNGCCEPVTWSKTFFRFLEAKRKDEQRLYQLAFCLDQSPHWERICTWLMENKETVSGWTVSAERLGIILASLYGSQEESSTTTNGGCESRAVATLLR